MIRRSTIKTSDALSALAAIKKDREAKKQIDKSEQDARIHFRTGMCETCYESAKREEEEEDNG